MKHLVEARMGLAALLAGGALLAAPVAAQSEEPTDAGLAAETLEQGESVRAIAMLESELAKFPGDPALQINLGIAQAQAGNEAAAREYFSAALANRNEVDVETVDGRVTDSRRLARLAISMLDRGEFREPRALASR